MVRLIAFLLTLDASAIAGAIVYTVLTHRADPALVGALAGAIGAFVASGAVALMNRTRGPNGEPQ